MKRVLLLACIAIASPFCVSCSTGPFATTSAQAAAVVPLSIKTAVGERRFKVEVARSPEEQERGLMFRKSLANDAGMIFPMLPPRMASFWMKNTLIPLDMIFIRADGSIARIEPETVPQTLDPVSSGEPIAAVLEIAGGQAAKQGISEGDTVIWDDPTS
jgi:uncharacterized protein